MARRIVRFDCVAAEVKQLDPRRPNALGKSARRAMKLMGEVVAHVLVGQLGFLPRLVLVLSCCHPEAGKRQREHQRTKQP